MPRYLIARYLIALIALLLVSCQSAIPPAAPAPSPTPQGPTVTSHNPDVVVESWEYISPRSEEALTFFPSGNPDVIRFGPEHYEAYVIWREGGFDLVWGNFICSTWPMLTIEDTTIKLWLNDYVWDDCDAAQVPHAFKVELQTDIPPEAWTYEVYPGSPQGPAVISNNPDAVVGRWRYINHRSEEWLTTFRFKDPEAIEFGPAHYEAYAIWREGGIDLVWGTFMCSTQPILIIENSTIKLWLNDGIWDDCDAAQVPHAFRVEMETDIPPEEWSYIIHQDAPPEFRLENH